MYLRYRWIQSLLAACVFFLLAACSSLEKAKELNKEGEKEKALEMASEYLGSENPKERIQAIRLIAKIGEGEKYRDQAGEKIQEKLFDADPDVQLEAIKQLGNLEFEPASDDLVALSTKVKGEAFEEVATAIRKIGKPAIEKLMKKYKFADSGKDKYKKMLLQVGAPITEFILVELKGKSHFENLDNYDILVALKNPQVAALMLPGIEDEEIAGQVMEGLVSLGSLSVDATLEYLQTKINTPVDSDKAVYRERAVIVLGRLKDERALPILEVMYHNEPSERVRIAIDHALKMIRNY